MPDSTGAPRVSILIPTYNRAHLLPQALEAALAQTYPSLEVVVSDNASSDDTASVLARYACPRLVAVRQPETIPPIQNINACLERATGDFVLVLSDDDVIVPECVAKLVAELMAHPGATVAWGRTRKERIDGTLIAVTAPGPKRVEPGLEYVLEWIDDRRETAFCCTMYHTEALRQLGGFPPFSAGDAAARGAVALRGTVVHCPEVLAHYRVHLQSDSYSFSVDAWMDQNAAMVNYIAERVPPVRREVFARLSRAHVIRATGIRLGEAVGRGMPLREAAACVRSVQRRYGWRTFTCWPWKSFLVHSLIPAGGVERLRRIRNRSR